VSVVETRILDRQALGRGGCVELLVSGNQGHRSEAGILLQLIDLESDGQLHSIVSPKPTFASDLHCLGKKGRRQFHDAIALGQMAAEMPEHGPGLSSRELAAVLPTSNRGCDLDRRNARDIEGMTGLRSHQRANPGTTDLDHMAFDESAGVEKIVAISAALADDGFRKGLSFDGDRLVIGVVEVVRSIRKLAHQPELQ
jgi:hypothetical protein